MINPIRFAMFVIMAAALTLSACGGDSEPQDREFDLRIEDGKLDLDPAVIKVSQGDSVTLRIDADEHGTFHLHGYDIEIEVGPDSTAVMDITASATGNFPITFHANDGGGHEAEGEGEKHDEEEEPTIASLEVHPR